MLSFAICSGTPLAPTAWKKNGRHKKCDLHHFVSSALPGETTKTSVFSFTVSDSILLPLESCTALSVFSECLPDSFISWLTLYSLLKDMAAGSLSKVSYFLQPHSVFTIFLMRIGWSRWKGHVVLSTRNLAQACEFECFYWITSGTATSERPRCSTSHVLHNVWSFTVAKLLVLQNYAFLFPFQS